MYSNEEIRSILEGAFKPLRCVANVHDYEHQLDFTIFDENDKRIIEMKNLILGNHRENHSLKAVINGIRGRVEEKHFALEPWELS